MTADEVPPEVVERIAANILDAVKAQRDANVTAARIAFSREAVEHSDFFLWSVELKVSTE